jgi:hypothetical protein
MSAAKPAAAKIPAPRTSPRGPPPEKPPDRRAQGQAADADREREDGDAGERGRQDGERPASR